MADRTSIEAHYAESGSGISDRILAALPPGSQVTPDALAPYDQFHGGGLAATRELAAMLDPKPGERIVDLGSGIGGPARWIAANFACHVSGVDLTSVFCEAAAALATATGQTDSVAFFHGSALETPFPSGAFDRAYSQNVIMNIADKAAFYREAFRVLKPGGVLAMSFIGDGPDGPPYYPSMWASQASDSFLASASDSRRQAETAGFAVEHLTEKAELPGPSIDTEIAKAATGPLPARGIHVLVGDGFRERTLNSLRSRRDRRISRIDMAARKPS